jgi:hypothetical protein
MEKPTVSSGSSNSRRLATLLGFLDPEDEAAAVLGNVGDFLPINT